MKLSYHQSSIGNRQLLNISAKPLKFINIDFYEMRCYLSDCPAVALALLSRGSNSLLSIATGLVVCVFNTVFCSSTAASVMLIE